MIVRYVFRRIASLHARVRAAHALIRLCSLLSANHAAPRPISCGTYHALVRGAYKQRRSCTRVCVRRIYTRCDAWKLFRSLHPRQLLGTVRFCWYPAIYTHTRSCVSVSMSVSVSVNMNVRARARAGAEAGAEAGADAGADASVRAKKRGEYRGVGERRKKRDWEKYTYLTCVRSRKLRPQPKLYEEPAARVYVIS